MKTVIRNNYSPKIGDYCETIVVDKETESAYIFDCDGVFTEMPQPVDVEDILRRAAEYTDEAVAPINEKLETIEEGAQVNKIEHVLKNGTELTITNKTVNVTVPTKTSELTNDGSDSTDTYVETAALSDYYTKTETDTQIGYETNAREIADAGLQEQIDAIVASSDVVDIVGTYAALQAYDTSKLHDNDIIKVLTDETRDDATTYYRWDSDTSTWSYIGAEGPFYTKAESDATFVPQTRTVNNKALSSDITLTAQDVGALPDSTVIPTVNDATLTIQKNGVDVATFTANSATNETANITVPTKTSDITNDSGFITEEDVYEEVCEAGKTITFQDAAPSQLSSFQLDGETSQNGTPTPDAPIPVQTVTGENVVRICEKNLLDIGSYLNESSDGLTFSYSNGKLTATGTPSPNEYANVTKKIATYLPAGTYTLSITQAVSHRVYLWLRYKDGTAASTFVINAGNTSATVSTAKEIAQIRLDFAGMTVGTAINETFGIQLEKSNSASTFEPYQGQSYEVNLGNIELCKIGDYQDYIYKSDGKWYVHKAVRHLSLLPSNMDNYDNTPGWRDVTQLSQDLGIDHNGAMASVTNYKCNVVLPDAATNLHLNINTIAQWNNNVLIVAGSGLTQTQWKNNYGSQAFEIYYGVLNASADTEITNEALITQLNALLTTARTYAGINNIFTITPNEQGTLEICYVNTILPYATKDKPGIVQIGDGLSVDSNGVISSDGLTSVDWDDIDNKPTNVSYWTNDAGYITAASLPTVNDATLTIQKNGTNVATFSANSATASTANITVPTDTGDLTNGAGFITTAALSNYYTKSETYSQQEVNSLINTLSIPTKTSDLTNDGSDGTSTYVEADELATVATTGDYDDLLNKPTIPTIVDMTGATSSTAGAHGYVPAPAAGDQEKYLKGDGTWATVQGGSSYTAGNGIDITNDVISADTSVLATQTDLAGKQDILTAGTNITIANDTISASIPIDSALDVSSSNPVENSVVTAALNGKSDKFVIMKYGESNAWAKFIDAYNNNKIVYCRASSNANPATGAQTRLAFMAYVSAETNPTNVEFQYVRSVSSKSDSQQCDQVYVYKLTNASGGTWTVEARNMASKIVAGTNMTSSYSNGTLTLNATQPTIPTKTSDLTNDGSDGTSTYVEADELATVATSGDYNDLTNLPAIPNYTAGDHIDITNNVITAEDYVHSENPVSVTPLSPTITGAEISDGSITFDKTSAGEFLKLQLTTTDPGEGSPLAANTLLGVYQ